MTQPIEFGAEHSIESVNLGRQAVELFQTGNQPVVYCEAVMCRAVQCNVVFLPVKAYFRVWRVERGELAVVAASGQISLSE